MDVAASIPLVPDNLASSSTPLRATLLQTIRLGAPTVAVGSVNLDDARILITATAHHAKASFDWAFHSLFLGTTAPPAA